MATVVTRTRHTVTVHVHCLLSVSVIVFEISVITAAVCLHRQLLGSWWRHVFALLGVFLRSKEALSADRIRLLSVPR